MDGHTAVVVYGLSLTTGDKSITIVQNICLCTVQEMKNMAKNSKLVKFFLMKRNYRNMVLVIVAVPGADGDGGVEQVGGCDNTQGDADTEGSLPM